jgi:tetratricopeptide (TPR) repeat protein
VTEGSFNQAEKSYLRILDVNDKAQHQWAFTWLASLYTLQGKYNKAVAQFERGLKLSKELRETGSVSGFYMRLAYAYLFSGEPDKALNESVKAELSSKEERGCLLSTRTGLCFTRALPRLKRK